ncbi:MAG: lysine 5,6-aminomutase subunit alpha [Candidatus Lernaella stagnicola]|nr:lysine 5,6-aminomutase subunit alpha [Candidatus Lernaella stagnicola]
MRLALDPSKIRHARELAAMIAEPVLKQSISHTTDSVERTTLRLMGLEGADADGVPLVNVLVRHLRSRLPEGISPLVLAAATERDLSLAELAQGVSEKKLDLSDFQMADRRASIDAARDRLSDGLKRITRQRKLRRDMIAELGEGPQPWLYVIVATGNIHEDIAQAQMAARQGADIVAVIRSTAQSLLDYVPEGVTTEGFGGTYATQANFALMREALDDVSREVGRYIRLVNYASGLCMPEIAAMGGLERLDMMLNDSMYGILFRDINPLRTFVDQHLSRMISAHSEIVINTGEDNYLTTTDAVEAAHTVLASDLINECFAVFAGLTPTLIGLGHAFEIKPELPNSFVLELAQALLVREVFPHHPIKYMPPTKHMTGDIFRGYAMNTMFNLAGVVTGQGIQLLGMLTEAMHTPFLMDRALAIKNASMVFNAARELGDSLEVKSDSPLARRADETLGNAIKFLERVRDEGLFSAIAAGRFADIQRPPEGGKGADGVVKKARDYANPLFSLLRKNHARI